MNPFKAYNQLFRRSPLFRALNYVAVIAIILAAIAMFGKQSKKLPAISQIDPMVAASGDIMTITGENFGDHRDNSYVEIAGSRLTASAYTKWSDREIKVTLPSNISDGLVVVGTSIGRSEPGFFANIESIPIVVHSDPQTTYPVIQSISPESASVGQLVTITGQNFGSVRGNSLVYFTANRSTQAKLNQSEQADSYTFSQEDFIPANDNEFDYNMWSDTEIRLRVPDGAESGPIYIATAKGESDSVNLDITFPAGKKEYKSKRTYAIQNTVDITANAPDQTANLTFYMPRPPVSSVQPVVEFSDYSIEPLIGDDPKSVIYQLPLAQAESRKHYTQNFAVTVYEIVSNIKGQNVQRFTNTKRSLYTTYTAPNSIIPCNSDSVIALRDEILGKEKNPYKQALAIYNYMIENYEISSTPRSGDVSIMDLRENKKGDAYDFAIMFVTLCRSAGIPALPVSGLLVEANNSSRIHWWAEIYFENYGWFPVDVSIAAGLKFSPFNKIDDTIQEYYFGNMDSQHVAFSRGWNQVKSSLQNGAPVYKSRSYALQSIWEEANSTTAGYTSSWTNPRVIGIY